MRARSLQVPLAGGPAKVAAEFEAAGGAHSPHCPTDSDLLLVDRDLPPNFWGGGESRRRPSKGSRPVSERSMMVR
jgi:hypothetical protein